MMAWLSAHGGIVGVVVLVGGVLNILLSAAKAVLEMLEPSAEKQAGSSLYQFVAKAIGWVKTVLDWLSANRPH